MNWQSYAADLAAMLQRRGITDVAVLARIASTPRHQFIPEVSLEEAYSDQALAIGEGQTISQPYIVALMTQEAQLQPTDQVLEIGTGSGYQTAILAPLCRSVISVERLPNLARQARQAWDQLPGTMDNVTSVVGDGSHGWAEGAPYDAIVVTAGAPSVPESYLQQLAPHGRLIIPVGDENHQELLCITQSDQRWRSRKLCDCRFVKLRGAEAWPHDSLPTRGDDPA